MAGIAIETIRVGQKYRLVNFDEVFEFEVLRKVSEKNFSLKDLHTLEKYQLQELIKFGRGKDFVILEL